MNKFNIKNPEIHYVTDIIDAVSSHRDKELADEKLPVDSPDFLTPAMHDQSTLFDEGDTKNLDVATGKVQRERSDLDQLASVGIEQLGQRALDEVMGMDNDPAAQWLAENDPEFGSDNPDDDI